MTDDPTIPELAATLGRPVGVCPACGAERRGKRDRRPAVWLKAGGIAWRCHRCRAGGGALSWAAQVVCGTTRPPSWAPVWEALRGVAVPQAPPPDRPDYSEPDHWREARRRHRREWASTLAQAREWQASGVPFHGDEPALDARDALVMALACRAVVAGVPTREAFEAAAVYVRARLGAPPP